MSARANPTAIGLFLLGALGIAIGGTAVLASATWFQDRTSFLSFFPESVNGLVLGAPVKFQGVPIGRVTGIHIEIDRRDNSFQVPVEYEIDLPRLTTPKGTFVNLADKAVLTGEIAKGLRAQLQMESLVTGVLYLELSYRRGAPPPRLETLRPTAHPEIPTTPSMMAAIGGGAGSLLAEVSRILNKVNLVLDQVDVKEMNLAVMRSAKSVEELVRAPEIRATLRQLPATTAQLRQTLEEAQRLAARATIALDSIQPGLTGTTTEAVSTLKTLRRTLDETQGLLSSDTGPGYALTGALQSLRQTSEALRLLILSLESNPDMLLRGKKPPDTP